MISACNVAINKATGDFIVRLDADDFFRNEKSAQFMRHLTYNHPEVIHAITAEVKSQERKPEFDLYK